MSTPVPTWRVLCAEPEHFDPEALDRLASDCHLERSSLTQDELVAAAADFDALLVRLRLRVTADVLASLPSLRAIVSPTTGLDHLDLEAARRADIAVIHLRGQTELLESITSTAEHAWALLLAVVRRIPAATAHVLGGGWRPDEFRGRELAGSTLGVLGHGRLGSKVARYGAAFGMRALAHDVEPDRITAPATGVDLDTLLRCSDVLSIHLPLAADTIGLLDEKRLRMLPRGAVVVNTSRAEIIDLDALLRCLDDGHIGGIGVDVRHDERSRRPADDGLVRRAQQDPRIVVTPHIGGATAEAVRKADEHCFDRLRALMTEGLA